MSRFEQKILFAMLLVALAPLVATIYLGRDILQDTYRVGVNQVFANQVEDAFQVRRQYLQAMRREVDLHADIFVLRLLGASNTTNAKINPDKFRELALADSLFAGAELSDEQGIVLASAQRRIDTGKTRMATITRELQLGSHTYQLRVQVVVPENEFERFQRAGGVAEVYSRLLSRSARVSSIYVWTYAGWAAAVIVVALGIGILISRRVTARVTTLEQATQKVGAGDLNVSIPTGPKDEVGELIGAFNSMVEDLRQSRDRIGYLQRINAWQDFARRLAHEIKNPLTPIQLAAQEIAQTYRGDDLEFAAKLQNARGIIEDEVATLRRLVGEFSEFGRLPSVNLQRGDLANVLRAFEPTIDATLADARTDRAHVSVKVEYPKYPVMVLLDKMMLKRCIDNLVRNAAQAIRAGGQSSGNIVVRLRTLEENARIEVIDNGPGIPEGERDRVFESYFTTKTEGTGLGLPIVKKIVLEHSGNISLLSQPAGGTSFLIEIPLANGDT